MPSDGSKFILVSFLQNLLLVHTLKEHLLRRNVIHLAVNRSLLFWTVQLGLSLFLLSKLLGLHINDVRRFKTKLKIVLTAELRKVLKTLDLGESQVHHFMMYHDANAQTKQLFFLGDLVPNNSGYIYTLVIKQQMRFIATLIFIFVEMEQF